MIRSVSRAWKCLWNARTFWIWLSWYQKPWYFIILLPTKVAFGRHCISCWTSFPDNMISSCFWFWFIVSFEWEIIVWSYWYIFIGVYRRETYLYEIYTDSYLIISVWDKLICILKLLLKSQSTGYRSPNCFLNNWIENNGWIWLL